MEIISTKNRWPEAETAVMLDFVILFDKDGRHMMPDNYSKSQTDYWKAVAKHAISLSRDRP